MTFCGVHYFGSGNSVYIVPLVDPLFSKKSSKRPKIPAPRKQNGMPHPDGPRAYRRSLSKAHKLTPLQEVFLMTLKELEVA